MAETESSRLRTTLADGRNCNLRRRPSDSDNDGMPDEWEKKYGFDANNADDNVVGQRRRWIHQRRRISQRHRSDRVRGLHASRKTTSIRWRSRMESNPHHIMDIDCCFLLLATMALGQAASTDGRRQATRDCHDRWRDRRRMFDGPVSALRERVRHRGDHHLQFAISLRTDTSGPATTGCSRI